MKQLQILLYGSERDVWQKSIDSLEAFMYFTVTMHVDAFDTTLKDLEAAVKFVLLLPTSNTLSTNNHQHRHAALLSPHVTLRW